MPMSKPSRAWEHLVALIFAQLSCADGLRGLIASFNANSQHHYHLWTEAGPLSRSTLSDANRRRPGCGVRRGFQPSGGPTRPAGRRREGAQMLRLIDSTPVPLGKLCDWAKSNGRIRGLKIHVVYDPNADCSRILDITDANINDAQIGRTVAIASGATYVFDKGYCHYGWWRAIADEKGSVFVTRPKTSMGLDILYRAPRLVSPRGNGFTIIEDSEVSFASKGDSLKPMRLRRVRLQTRRGLRSHHPPHQ